MTSVQVRFDFGGGGDVEGGGIWWSGPMGDTNDARITFPIRVGRWDRVHLLYPSPLVITGGGGVAVSKFGCVVVPGGVGGQWLPPEQRRRRRCGDAHRAAKKTP